MTATGATRTSRCSAAVERRHAHTNALLAEAHETTDQDERRRILDEVVLENLEVARSIARKYRHRGIPTDDLQQVAYMGLIQAATRYDPTKADDFLSYAVPTIRGEVRRHFRDLGWAVRPPRSVQELQAAVNADASDPARGEDDLTDDAIAARLGVAVDRVREARAAQGCFSPTSLDTPVGPGQDPLMATLVDDDLEEYEAAEARVILRALTRDLTPRDRLILYLRFVEGRTQQEIGQEIGVTQMQVSRLLARLLTQMRDRANLDTTTGATAVLAS